MRIITLIIIHCSATKVSQNYGFEACRTDHIRHRRFNDIGYHFYITRDGEVHNGRPVEKIGAHCKFHNRHSIGICYEGGLDEAGNAADTRTPLQKAALLGLIGELRKLFPRATVVGHHDMNPGKLCPCFDAIREYNVL